MNPFHLFPLIARPRPACTPLTQRISDLQDRTAHAHHTGDTTTAATVFNLAALLASDCGLPDLARTWCHRLARAALGNDRNPRHGLEPIVNLARLHIRAGNGETAWTLLETLHQAIDTRTDTVIDGLTIPASRLTDTTEAHTRLRSWLWKVLLGTGAHALAVDGKWDDASRRLAAYKGIGNRMLDGRQVTIIARIVAGRRNHAHAMLEATEPGEAWENAVTTCLTLLATDGVAADLPALSAYLDRGPTDHNLIVFHTRLGLTTLEALGATDPAADHIIAGLIDHAGRDGYAARDLLRHLACLDTTPQRQTRQLTALVEQCGLGAGEIPKPLLTQLAAALDTAESVITRPSSSF